MHPFLSLPLYDIPDSPISSTSGSPAEKHWIFISSAEQMDLQIMDFLSKILASIDINLSSNVYLVPMTSDQRIYVHKYIPEGSGKKHILCFGIPPEDLGLSIKKDLYHPVQLNGHTFLFCDHLGGIQSDANKKRALWESLQSIKSNK